MSGAEESKVLKEAGVDVAPPAHRAVLVGTALSPGQASVKPDGTEVRTLWGEMAWQLGGKPAYQMIEHSDQTGTSPGSHDLVALFNAHSPCLILIDEWVAYARQLVGKEDLPAGTFESQGSFAQALTEAAKAAERTLVVASIPASKIEIGGYNGQHALEVLKNVFTRVGKPWRPATSDEGFEIVRRRLFEPISGKEHFAARDATINAFAKMYRNHQGEFPSETGEGRYRDDLRSSYPFQPEWSLQHRSRVSMLYDAAVEVERLLIACGPPGIHHADLGATLVGVMTYASASRL